jgi:hypothetical protein
MQISRRVTNGLAWAGLIVVVGIPSADIISAQVMGEGTARAAVVGKPIVIEPATTQRLDEVADEDVAAVKTAPIPADRPDRPQVASTTGDPVDQYLETGRELPSYISGGGEQQAAVTATPSQNPAPDAAPQQAQAGAIPATQAPSTKPAATQTASVDATAKPATTTAPAAGDPIDPVEVASIDPTQKIAPVPMPLAMRPTPMTRPTAPQEALIVPEDDRAPGFDRAPDFPVIVPNPDGFPVVPPRDVARGGNDIVSAEELEAWESGPLSDFLAGRRGPGEPDFDADGFFLDEGPDSSATFRRRQLPPDIVYVYPVN